MADKMTGKKPKKVRADKTVVESGQKGAEATSAQKGVDQRKKK
jgi:hypothetical protein